MITASGIAAASRRATVAATISTVISACSLFTMKEQIARVLNVHFANFMETDRETAATVALFNASLRKSDFMITA